LNGAYALDKDGYDSNGFNLAGFDKDGYNALGASSPWFCSVRSHADSLTLIRPLTGFDKDGYDRQGYDRNGACFMALNARRSSRR